MLSTNSYLAYLDECKKGYHPACFHENQECQGGIIKAHSIQNNRILTKIAINQKVLCINNDLSKNHFLKEVVKKQATIFRGFCQKHDNSIFVPIERKPYQEGDKEQEFLFAYRALAKEYSATKEAVHLLKNFRKEVDQPSVESNILGLEFKLKKLEQERKKFNKALDRKKFNYIDTKIITFDHEYLIAVSSVISPEKDLKGNTFNNFGDLSQDIKDIYLTIFPDSGKTFILLSATKNNQKNLDSFYNQIVHSKSLEQQQEIITNLIAIHVENFVLSKEINEKYPKIINNFIDLSKKTIYTEKETMTNFKKINLFRI